MARWIWIGSLLGHAGAFAAFGQMEPSTTDAPTPVTMIDATDVPPPPPAEPERPAEPAAEPVKAAAPAAAPPKAAPAAKAAAPTGAAQPAGGEGARDFGLELGDGPGGLPVAPGGGGGAPPAATTAAPAKVPTPVQRAPQPDACDEPVAKAKPLAVPTPAYPEAARTAGVEGKVRVEVTLDEGGKVTAARVIAGLGHGLDEAALAAAKRASFQSATRCGKPVGSTFVIAIRFAL